MMRREESQYAYFETLEWTVKLSLGAYALVLLAETAAIVLGVDRAVDFAITASGITFGLGAGAAVAVFLLLLIGIGQIPWLGELHVRLDRVCFGFLKRSNNAIFDELIAALEPAERRSVRGRSAAVRGSLMQSVFARLSDDYSLFEQLLESGIFKYWIWYWVAIHGTFAFALLTAESSSAMLIRNDSYTTTLFTINWITALAHIVMTVLLGFHLVQATRASVGRIVRMRGDEIAEIFRENLDRVAAAVN